MNPELYTEEFRSFKYLRSSKKAVEYFKEAYEIVNRVQPLNGLENTNFVWPTRIEFIEQLIDLSDSIVYLVETKSLYYRYEDARIRKIVNPIIYKGKLSKPSSLVPITIEDVRIIENTEESNIENEKFYLGKPGIAEGDTVLNLSEMPIVPINRPSFDAMFYDEGWASRYRSAVKKYYI